jgi:hypothetical protein
VKSLHLNGDGRASKLILSEDSYNSFSRNTFGLVQAQPIYNMDNILLVFMIIHITICLCIILYVNCLCADKFFKNVHRKLQRSVRPG